MIMCLFFWPPTNDKKTTNMSMRAYRLVGFPSWRSVLATCALVFYIVSSCCCFVGFDRFQTIFYTPPTVIRKSIWARDTGCVLCLYSFPDMFSTTCIVFPRFLNTRFLIAVLSYYRGGRCMWHRMPNSINLQWKAKAGT